MRWLVEVSRVSDGSATERYCIEARRWQSALQEVRRLRGDEGPLPKLTIELLDEGYRAVDTELKVRYVVSEAPPDMAVTAEAQVRQTTMPPPAVDSATETALPAAPKAPTGVDSKEPADALSESSSSGQPPRVAPNALQLLAAQVIRERDESPTPENPIRYHELALAVRPGVSRESLEALLLARLEQARATLNAGSAKQYVQIAIFDHMFVKRPVRAPIATLAWKDWRGDPLLAFPVTAVTESASDEPPPSAPAPSSIAPSWLPPRDGLGPGTSVAPIPVLAVGSAASAMEPQPAQTEAQRISVIPTRVVSVGAPPRASVPPASQGVVTTVYPSVGPESFDPEDIDVEITVESGLPPSELSGTEPLPLVRSHPPRPAHVAEPEAPVALPAQHPSPAPGLQAVVPADGAMAEAIAPPPEVAAHVIAVHVEAAPVVVAPAEAAPVVAPAEAAPVVVPAEAAPVVAPAEAAPAVVAAVIAPSIPPPKPASSRSQRPPSSPELRRRSAGEDLIGELFERMHELSFMADVVSGAEFVLHVLGELIPCEGILIHVFDIDKRRFVVVRARGPNAAAVLLHKTPDNEPLVRQIMSRRSALVLDGAPANAPPASSALEKLGIVPRAVLSGAARLGGRYLGLIELANPLGGLPFHAGEANALDYVCEQFAEFVASRPVVLDEDVVLG